ncbi:MAG: hypothetical protein RI891_376, partial [Gemmatimonadota bacterium]
KNMRWRTHIRANRRTPMLDEPEAVADG